MSRNKKPSPASIILPLVDPEEGKDKKFKDFCHPVIPPYYISKETSTSRPREYLIGRRDRLQIRLMPFTNQIRLFEFSYDFGDDDEKENWQHA